MSTDADRPSARDIASSLASPELQEWHRRRSSSADAERRRELLRELGRPARRLRALGWGAGAAIAAGLLGLFIVLPRERADAGLFRADPRAVHPLLRSAPREGWLPGDPLQLLVEMKEPSVVRLIEIESGRARFVDAGLRGGKPLAVSPGREEPLLDDGANLAPETPPGLLVLIVLAARDEQAYSALDEAALCRALEDALPDGSPIEGALARALGGAAIEGRVVLLDVEEP